MITAVSAWYGMIGLIGGAVGLGAVTDRIPLHSPVFAGIALGLVVALPATFTAILCLRSHPRAGAASTLAGVLLLAWIIVELAVVREFSFLQPLCALLGVLLIALGDRLVLRQVLEVLTALPLFVSAPLWRHWHLRWGATPEEAAAAMPGDELVPVSHFTATRAVTVHAPAGQVWPWIVQAGYRRAGFYSYDLLDNLARPSARELLPQWQGLREGDVAAPMAYPPTTATSFVIARSTPPEVLVWAKPDSTWSWVLKDLQDGRTRVTTRIRQRYRPAPATLLTVLLAEFGDFPMMRKMLIGIKSRAESTRSEPRRIRRVEKVFTDVDGVRQGMFIESEDRSAPVLLILHGGLPEYFMTERHPTGLEKDFTTVWWEQRGAGLSYRPDLPPESITLDQLVADTSEVAEYLRKRFHKDKIYLMGHSGGTFIGLQAAARAPELFHAYVGVAQMVRQLESERRAYEYMLAKFRDAGDHGMVRRLEAAPVTLEAGVPDAYLALRDKAMHSLGLGTTHDMKSIVSGVFWPSLRSSCYTPREKVRLWRGKRASGVSALWDDMINTDLTDHVRELAIPAYFFHGVYDYTVNYRLAREYFDQLKAPRKGFYTFARSAHSPILEEPDRVRGIMRADVLAGETGLADNSIQLRGERHEWFRDASAGRSAAAGGAEPFQVPPRP